MLTVRDELSLVYMFGKVPCVFGLLPWQLALAEIM